MSASVVYTVVKIGGRDRMEAFRMKGEVYFNTWGYFKRLEANTVQGDHDEGLQTILQISRGVQLHVEINGKFDQLTDYLGKSE